MKNNSKKYEKNCPNCGKVQTYKSKQILKQSIKKNTWCGSCATSKAVSGNNNGMYGKKHSKETIEKIKKKRAEQVITDETRKKMSESHKGLHEGVDNNFYGKTHTKQTRRKMREIATKRIINNNWHPSYNEEACIVINEYGNENGYNFRTAEHEDGEYYIEELGYWVDGYDERKNVVIEYYEEKHKYQEEKDLKRQQEIEEYLGCEFIIIREWT